MSSFYEDASLVMIPSGYKTSKVYCAKPTDGAGDLTFTRSNDTATRVNSAGLIEKVRTNLLTYSQDFSQAVWNKENVTLTGGQTDPLGGSNGWRFNETTANGQHRFYYTFLSFTSGSMTQSVYVKSLGRDQILFGSDSNANSLVFTFSTETISNVTGYSSTSVTNVGNGWYRLSATFLGFSPINCCFVQGYSGGSISYTGDTSKGFFAFGAQIEASDFGATPYIATTSAAVSVGPVANVPRLDYLNSSCPRLLLEPQRTNLYPYSEQLNQWTASSATVTANYAVSPDGYTNADRVQFAAGGLLYVSGTGSAGENTLSVYAKATNGTSAKFRFFGNGNTTNSSDQTATGQWQRFTFTYTYSAATAGLKVATTGADDVIFYGFQHEIGAYATSYIPTLGAAVTRAQDQAEKASISSLIGATEGTMFVDILFTGAADNNPVYIQTWASQTERLGLFYSISSNLIRPYLVTSSGSADFSLGFTPTAGTRYKMAFCYKANDYAFFVNGAQVTIDARATVPTAGTKLFVGCLDSAAQANRQFSNINQALLFKTRLTNSELAALTTL